MKRHTLSALLLVGAMTFSLAACGSQPVGQTDSSTPPATVTPISPLPGESDLPTPSAPSATPFPAPSDPGQGETPTTTPPIVTPLPTATQPPAEATDEPEAPRILIAYFTWAENTVVEDPAAVDIDASTSASVLLPGNAAKMAGWIQQEVGGDLFSIVVEDPYSSDYDECLDRAADEKAANARPVLVGQVDNMADYDIVFLGFPNWWYTLPMAVLSFVEAYDFSGKTIVPFVTHGTGGLASTIRDLTAALPGDVTILDAIGVYRPEVDASQDRVQSWARDLDLD